MTDVLALAEDALVSNINCKRCCDVLVFVCSFGLYTGNWPELHSKPARISLKASASATSLYSQFHVKVVFVLCSPTQAHKDEFSSSNTAALMNYESGESNLRSR